MQRANDVVACGVADDVDDVGNIQGSVEGVGCVGSEGGGGKDNPTSSPPLPPRPIPARHRELRTGCSLQGYLHSTEVCIVFMLHCNILLDPRNSVHVTL